MKRILAIDDQPDNLTTIKAVIKAHIPNCKVLTALSGKEGIEVAQKECPDTILLDIIMPNMDGYETCKRLKTNELTKHIPVIMVTAIRTDSEDRAKGLDMGADVFVSKPIDPIELSAQVRVMLRIKDAEDKLRTEKEGLEEIVLKRTRELQESEAKLKSIFRAAPTGIGVTIDRVFQFVNQRFVDISGYSSSELIGQSTRKIYQTDKEFERVGKYKYDQIKLTGTGTLETQFLRKDGRIIDILLSSTPIDLNDFSKGVTFTALDITDRKKSEETLKSSEERLSILFDSAPMAYYLSDLKGTFLDGNKAAEKLIGYKKEELIDKNYFNLEILSEIGIATATKAIAKNLMGKKFGPEEIVVKHKDGSQVPIEITTYPVKIGGKPVILGNAIDISYRKKAEKEILEREEQYRDLVEKADIAVLKDDVSGRFTYFNEKFPKLFGYSAKEIKENSIESLVHPDDVDRVMELHNSHIKGIPGSYRYEFKGLKKDGASIELEVDSVLLEENNKIVGTRSYIWDITKRKIAEEAIRESEEKYKALYNNAPLSYQSLDENGRFLDINPAWLNTLGYQRKEVIGKSFADFLHTDFVPHFEKNFPEFKKRGYVNDVQFKIRHKDGHFLDISFEGCIGCHPDGSFKQTYCVFQDITESKLAKESLMAALEKATESDRLKSAFLANISHEIRTPMNGILGFSSLLREPKLSGEKQDKYVDIIEKSGARMLNIINNLVDISKIEAGLMKVMISSTNINNEIDELFAFFKPEVEKKNMILLSNKALPDSKAVIDTDKQKLNSILINLLKNAIKYTDTGSIEFGYTLSMDAKLKDGSGSLGGREMVFYIKDTGIGIPENRQEAIFDRFVQADIEDRDAREGSGLGLSISKAYIETLGGRIWLNSVPKKGTEFYFTIPYSVNPNLEPERTRNISEKVFQELSNKINTLIVEDEEFASIFLTEIVKGISNKILYAKTGSEAVEIAKTNPDIDLILMDIKMSDLNGIDATKRIRQFNKEVIIIAQTAYALAGDKEIAIGAGCNDYISKPIDPGLLYAKIKGLLEN